ncbi:MAG: leucine-rich repeat domain-containing protein [Mogibacterium sp.]|nr:leucine-rich repeat domain-containing protein [Mogibacterium sp.]
MEKKNNVSSKEKTKLVKRVLAIVMAFAIVVSMSIAYAPDRFLRANEEGETVTEPTVTEQEVQVEEKAAEEKKEEAVPQEEEATEEIVLEDQSGQNKAEEPAAAENQDAEAAEEAVVEEEAVEEEKTASIKFFAGGSEVSSVTVEKARGSNPSQYWKDLTAKVVGAEDQKYKISWSSTDKTIAKPLTDKVDTKLCNDIKILGYKLGTVTFTASADVNGETISSTITVNVGESSTWTDGESEVAWEIAPGGELKVSSTGGTVDFGSANAPWSTYKNSITTVVIDDSVTSIGKKAFSGCSSLEQVTIGKNVNTISAEAFTDCRKLRDVTFADKESIQTIEAGAFRHCDQLTELDLSGCVNLKVIESDPNDWTKGAFSYGGRNNVAERNLIKVDLTGCSNLEEIGDGAFYDRRYIDLDMSSLTNLVRIGTGALEDKHEFNRIDFSVFTKLKEIGEFAFRNNTGVVTIDMSGDNEYALEVIRADAFEISRGFSSNLTSVDLSGCHQLSTIESGAFQWSGGTGSKTLNSVNLSGTALTALEANTFLNQNTLTSISIPSGMERIDDSAFQGCSGIREIRWEATDYTRSVANTFKSVSAKDRAAMKITIGKDVNVLPEDFFTSLSGAAIEFEPGNDNIVLRLAGDSEARTYIVDENGKLYLKVEDADHDYTQDEELSAGESWLDLEDRQTLTYNGDEQVLVVPVIPEEGKLSYRFSTDGKNEWKELTEETRTVISAVDAGIYEIIFRLTGVVNGVNVDKTASTKVEIGKQANPVKITVNGLSMTPNSPAHDFSKDLALAEGYDGSINDFDIAYQVNGMTSGRQRIQETYISAGRSGGSITAGGVYTPNAAGGVDIVTITIDGKGDKAGNIEQVIYKVPVKVELDVHTITYTDGFGNVIDEISAREGKAVRSPEDPSVEGFWFTGWNQEIPANMPEGDVTIEAQWEPIRQLMLTPKSAEYYYDGTEKNVEGFVSTKAGYDGDYYTISGVDAEASGTEIGVYEVEISGTPSIKDASGEDVSYRFTVGYDDANLKISEAPKAEDDTVIINYVDENGKPVADSVTAGSLTGPIVSPEIQDMTPEFSAVEINGAANTSVDVVYSAGNPDPDRYVLGAVDQNGQLTEIMSSEVPLASENGAEIISEPIEAGHWALVNLALMIAAIILAAYIIISGGSFMSVASIASALIAVIAAVIFFMTEDLTGAMVLTDKMTVIMANAVLAELIALLCRSRETGEEE